MSQPLNVLQLISSLEVGGAEKLLIDFLRVARNDNARFTVVVMNDAVNPEMRRSLEALGYPVYFLGRSEGHKHPRYLWQLMQIIHRHDINVVHAHNGGSKLWACLCKMAMPALKLVFTVHDTRIITRLNEPQRKLHRHVIDLNLAISKAVEKECHEADIHNCRQIYNGIDLERFSPLPFAGKAGQLRIINVARMEHRKKGQDVLIRALKLCRNGGLDFHCKLVGGVYDYNQESYQYLRQLARKLELEDVIEFVTDCHDAAPLLAESDLFVLPSRYEGLGLVVLEAMAAGVPVIASNLDGPAELIDDGVNGILFEPDNEMSLAAKIFQLAHHPETLERLRTAALSHVEPFDIRHMKNQYLYAYEDLLAHKPVAIRQPARRLEHGTPV